jgi:hypothetical protein
MKSARMYDFTIPANGSFQLNVEGEYVRIMSSTGTLELVTDTYRIGPIAAGQGQANAPFKRLTINDKSGNINKGVILVAASDFVDQRISGEVSIIDGGKSRTLAGIAFMGDMSQLAGAAQISTVQLFNPVANLKNLIIKSFHVLSTVIGSSLYGLNATALTTLDISGRAQSKKTGSIAITAELRSQLMAVQLSPFLGVTTYGANSDTLIRLDEPLIVTPGYGFFVQTIQANNTAEAVFEWIEETI